MFEIELKAHVANLSIVEKQLHSFATYVGFTEKHDTYWALNNAHWVRVRVDEVKTLITFKHKEIYQDIEVNNEKEFSVSDKENFEAFLITTGFTAQRQKHKSTKIWTYENASIELSSVQNLGDFIEIEILSDSTESLVLDAYRKKLHKILSLAGVPESAIETRFYSEMLQE